MNWGGSQKYFLPKKGRVLPMNLRAENAYHLDKTPGFGPQIFNFDRNIRYGVFPGAPLFFGPDIKPPFFPKKP